MNTNRGIEFENRIMRLLPYLGFYSVAGTKTSGDYGIDIIAYKDGKKYGFQCKSYSGSVGIRAVQEAISGQKFYDCDYAGVITDSFFTDNAKNLAKTAGVLLFDRTFLENIPDTAEHSTIRIPLDSMECHSNSDLQLGFDLQQKPVFLQLNDNVLVTGGVRTGKTFLMNALLYQMCPCNFRTLVIDTSNLGYIFMQDSPALLAPIATNSQKGNDIFHKVIEVINTRIELFKKINANNIAYYNSKVDEKNRIPLIYLIIDDASLFLRSTGYRNVEVLKTILLQGRNVGVLCIAVTAYPTKQFVELLPYFTNRIFFKGADKNFLNEYSAGNLGQGEFLYKTAEGMAYNGNTYYIADTILEKYSREHKPATEINDNKDNDKEKRRYNRALEIVLDYGQASVELIQRSLGADYSEAVKLLERMEKEGFVSASDGIHPRKVLVQWNDNDENKQNQKNIEQEENNKALRIAGEIKVLKERRQYFQQKKDSIPFYNRIEKKKIKEQIRELDGELEDLYTEYKKLEILRKARDEEVDYYMPDEYGI